MDRIIVLAVHGCLGSALLGTLDLLALAREGLKSQGLSANFGTQSASLDGATVTDGHGRRHDVDLAFADVARCAAVLIPGFVPIEGRAPDFPGTSPEARWIKAQHAAGAAIAASCSGVFLPGAAGLLEGRRCTTTWWLHDELRARHPAADAAFGSTLVEDKRVITAGGGGRSPGSTPPSPSYDGSSARTRPGARLTLRLSTLPRRARPSTYPRVI